jgi:hypothetical protein
VLCALAVGSCEVVFLVSVMWSVGDQWCLLGGVCWCIQTGSDQRMKHANDTCGLELPTVSHFCGGMKSRDALMAD